MVASSWEGTFRSSLHACIWNFWKCEVLNRAKIGVWIIQDMGNDVKMLSSAQRQMYPQEWDGNTQLLDNGDCRRPDGMWVSGDGRKGACR